MNWPATLRYGIDAAPAGLALVQDLLNTAPAGPREPDLLDHPETALTWWDETRTSSEPAARRIPTELVLTESDLDGLRTFRDALRLVVTGNNTGDDELKRSECVVAARGNGAVANGRRRPGAGRAARQGLTRIASVALIEVMEAQRVDTWRRLKTCRETLCRAAFYDRSRNNGRVWHDVHTCGDAVNLRAYRDRQRVARSHPSESS